MSAVIRNEHFGSRVVKIDNDNYFFVFLPDKEHTSIDYALLLPTDLKHYAICEYDRPKEVSILYTNGADKHGWYIINDKGIHDISEYLTGHLDNTKIKHINLIGTISSDNRWKGIMWVEYDKNNTNAILVFDKRGMKRFDIGNNLNGKVVCETKLLVKTDDKKNPVVMYHLGVHTTTPKPIILNYHKYKELCEIPFKETMHHTETHSNYFLCTAFDSGYFYGNRRDIYVKWVEWKLSSQIKNKGIEKVLYNDWNDTVFLLTKSNELYVLDENRRFKKIEEGIMDCIFGVTSGEFVGLREDGAIVEFDTAIMKTKPRKKVAVKDVTKLLTQYRIIKDINNLSLDEARKYGMKKKTSSNLIYGYGFAYIKNDNLIRATINKTNLSLNVNVGEKVIIDKLRNNEYLQTHICSNPHIAINYLC